ncbi:hypothetical protein RvY_15171 [Ramazzottius varieornatus]|uniref:RWD domain-containing protein n=1 Tax=Ramazzottius varieornatus TaxID=947166 RepID=A0A1D1VTY4_RAMVA|nr:hypothetical protein RvY_15171 [Ramazzottius varieornatus]
MGSSEANDYQQMLEDEITMLDSIYPGEFQLGKLNPADGNSNAPAASFKMLIHPATAGDFSRQNISLILELLLRSTYPDSAPIVRFHQPRGLSDLQLSGLVRELEDEASKRTGSPMIYDLIDIVRDYLTRTNFPSVECPFCLCNIEEGDEFFKTECFHYYHTFCLRKYLEFLTRQEKEIHNSGFPFVLTSCVVCRSQFSSPVSLDTLTSSREPSTVAVLPEGFQPTTDFERERQWRASVFEQQKARKGLIEPDDCFVITLNHIPEVDRQIQEAEQALMYSEDSS